MRWLKNLRCRLNIHPEFEVVQMITFDIDLIECTRCGKRYSINYSARVVLPWNRELEKHHKKQGPFMPIYEFECRLCGEISGRYRPVLRAGDKMTTCDHCGGVAVKVISKPNIQDEHPKWIDDKLRSQIQDDDEPPIESRTDLNKAVKEKGLVENPKS